MCHSLGQMLIIIIIFIIIIIIIIVLFRKTITWLAQAKVYGYMIFLYIYSSSHFCILSNIHRCFIKTCFTTLKSWWRFIKTEMYLCWLSIVINSSLLEYFVFLFSLYCRFISIIYFHTHTHTHALTHTHTHTHTNTYIERFNFKHSMENFEKIYYNS